MQYLEVEIPGEASRQYPVGREPIVIGRAPECDIRIDRMSIRDRHARVSRELTVHAIDQGASGVRYHGRQVLREVIEVNQSFELDPGGSIRVSLKNGDPETKTDEGGELGALGAKLRRVENEKAELVAKVRSLETQLRLSRKSTSERIPMLREETAREWIGAILGDDAPPVGDAEGITVERAETHLKFALVELCTFASSIEQTAAAHGQLGGPGHGGLKDRLRRIFESDHPRREQKELRRFLERLQVAAVRASVHSYRHSVDRWVTAFLKRLWSLHARAVAGGGRLPSFGYRSARLWKELETFLEQFTPDVVLDEIGDDWEQMKESRRETIDS